ncbi:hypothetical protein M433DRAFT_196061 [Acidomyces richmondensis BFW]|nr:MAG: hypothetical protein FE78DRAFT_31465 [Acidomyces sp. 'richmondensis']KYG40584.1 hypothetical protein M433DRAFT_196061 [Acidomyces richmondensis BFW]
MGFLLYSLITTSYLAVAAKALPKPHAAVTYSVVNVDGGSTTQAAAPPTTIYETVTELQSPPPAIGTTVSVTILETPSLTQATSTKSMSLSPSFSSVFPAPSLTSSSAGASVITASGPELIDPTPTSSSSVFPSSSDPVVEVSAFGPETTVTVTSVSVEIPAPSSTTYYDNGMWHTSYPVKPWWTSRPESQTRSAWNRTVTNLE